jgi:hypothetical protein
LIRAVRTRASLALTLTVILQGGRAYAQDPPTAADIQDAPACHLLLSVTATGAIQLAQVTESNGSSMLDEACLNSIIIRRFKPNAEDTATSSHWVEFTMKMIMKLPHKVAQAVQSRPPLPIPVLSHDQPLDLSRYRDAAGDAPLPVPVCATQAVVSADGTLTRLNITTGTGSPRWDAACMDAIRSLSFSPALQDGKPVAAATDIWLNWQSSTRP